MHKIISRTMFTLLLFVLLMSSLSLKVSAEETNYTPSGIAYSELKDVIDNYVNEYIGNTTAGASVAVLQNDETIFKSNYGYSDIKNKIPITDNTVFEWGSVTKLFVWVSVMQLVEEDKLDLNEDIKVYLPENFFKKSQFKQPITMLNLMNHNGGWEEHLTDLFNSNPQNVKSLKETLEIFEPKQVYKPGEVVSYSNYGAGLAAYIVECITGMDFYEYVNQYIFDVLDMKKTSIHPLQEDNLFIQKNRQLTKGYSNGFKERPIYYLGLYPAGGAIGTLSDMCKFVSALIPKDGETSPLFKKEDTLDFLFSKSYVPTDDFPGISHGFWEHYYSVRTLEHGGNTDSFSAQITFAPEEGVAVLIMSNQAHERAICFGLKDKIFGSYKTDNFDGELPDSSIVKGNYWSMRRTHSGFSQWMNLIINEVTVVDENTIDIDGDVYYQIRPYVYQYTDKGGASELIYLDVINGQVKSMYQEYGEYEPISNLVVISRLGVMAFLVFSLIYFIFAFIISVIYGLKRKNNLSIKAKRMIILNIVGFVSIVNTGILFYRSSMYPSYNDLKIHFIVNIIAVVLIMFTLCRNLISAIKRKTEDKRKIGYILANIIAVLYVVIIVACGIYK
ncbi:serine hydrolase [Mycoplasmatota bacterium]|nr:serine hydrolase [Mycoplasmatota bacterium]